MGRRFVVAVVALLLVGGTFGIATAEAGATITEDESTRLGGGVGPHETGRDAGVQKSNDSRDGPWVTVTARRTATGDATVRYEVRIDGLDDVDALWILTDDAEVTRSAGVDMTGAGPGRRKWNGDAATVRVTVVPRGDPSTDGSLAITREEWTFAPVPTLVMAWRPSDGGGLERLHPFEQQRHDRVNVTASEKGVVGERWALLGAATVYTRETADGRVRLVVPATVTPRSDPEAVLDGLAATARRFDDGGGRDDVLFFVLPPSVREGGATFVDSDETWVNADADLGAANNVWIHEYVHTRQSFELGPRMTWFREASAEYYGGRMARETGLSSSFEYEVYRIGRSGSNSDAVLADMTTWSDDDVPYQRGARVLSALDREIRDRTEGERSLEDVFRRLNRHDGVVTYEVFVAEVSNVAGADMRIWIDRRVAGTAPAGYSAIRILDLISDGETWPTRYLPLFLGLSLVGFVVARNRGWR